jgi:hypothetical protein
MMRIQLAALELRSASLAALLLVSAAPRIHANELCLAPSTDLRNPGLNVSVDCAPLPDQFDNDWIGYGTSADSLCRSARPLCEPDTLGLPRYGWTISASSTDPHQNIGTLEGDFGVLYLWFACSTVEGVAAAAFDLVGPLQVLAFNPQNGFLNAGTATSLMLAVGGCPRGPLLAGEIIVRRAPPDSSASARSTARPDSTGATPELPKAKSDRGDRKKGK